MVGGVVDRVDAEGGCLASEVQQKKGSLIKVI